jgi:RNA polymerase-binding transcription factor DksA
VAHVPTGVLTAGEVEELHRLLLAERARLGRQAAWLELTYQELVDAADLEPPDDEHDPDGTTAYERAQVGSLERASRARIEQVALALRQLAEGTYGGCDRCGRPIGFDRLAAIPGTTRCVDCAGA